VQSKKPKPGYKIVETKFRGNFEIPEEWDLSKLGNECKFEYGKGLTEENRDNTGFFVYGSGGIIGKHSKFFTNGPGIIIARKGSLGNVFFEEGNFWPIDTVFYISKNETKHNLQFMFYLLVYLKLKKYKIVTAHPGISRDEIYTIFIKIPPSEEQEKIVSILSNIDDLIISYDGIISQTKRLKQGLMQQLLRKGIGHKKFKEIKMGLRYMIETYPESWEIVCLESIAKLNRGKFSHRPRDDPAFFNGEFPFIQTGDVEKSTGYITKHVQTLNQKGISVSRLFPENIIVITIAATIGATAITTYPVSFPDSLIGISTSKMNIRYLEYFLRTRKKFLNIIATTSTQKNINYDTLNPLLIPKPELAEQEKIATILGNMDNKISKLESKKQIVLNLKKNIMQKLLTGQIRV
jgi:type I restriction enzyme, S subunit